MIMFGGELLRNCMEPVDIVLPDGTKEIYEAAAANTPGVHVNFWRRPVGKTRFFRQRWEPMAKITADPGIYDLSPFWNQVEALKAAAAEQQT